jgi:hypothetical protein
MIGVTYGAPTEFKAQGKTFDDPINWIPSDVKGSLWQDDLYVQLTFLMTMDQFGIDAPAKKFQELFAKAGYELWHANVQGRKNYFDSIFPPQSGHPDYNIHADDIDFQIEADYIGFMCPGMPQTSNKIADKIGHIMNYGDGVYGGAFIGALYSQAYFENDIRKLVELALQSLPAESDYYKIVKDAILLHDQFPTDWRTAWKELETKWGSEHICDAGTSSNIDAKYNGAFIVIGLLYGEGDPVKTMEITTRCGQDSDCNPATAAGILGVMLGYENIPSNWTIAIEKVQDVKFPYSELTLNQVYGLSYKHATQLIEQEGGKIINDMVTIKIQKPEILRLEQSFEGIYPTKELLIRTDHLENDITLDFEGTGIVVLGNVKSQCSISKSDFVAQLEIYIDGIKTDEFPMPYDYIVRKYDIYHNYDLSKGKHHLEVRWANKNPEFRMYFRSYVVYNNEPSKSTVQQEIK